MITHLFSKFKFSVKIVTAAVLFSAFFLYPKFCFALDNSASVVKIFVTSNAMDYYHPWQSEGMQTSSGSGVIIADKQILTNAHVVSDATFIQVKKNGDPRKYVAQVKAAGHDCDLAILTVSDQEFFKKTKPVKFGELVKLQDAVTVLGYPMGGGKISITKGVVSRIEMRPYAYSSKSLLAIQIDAAINPGNSGGPVLKDDKLVGVAMQGYTYAQNIGYMIPIPVIHHFLDDLEDGSYDGFPLLGVRYMNTENKNLRALYGIENQEGGVVVSRVLPFSSADEWIQEDDIIVSIDGINIDEDGTFQFTDEERLSLPYLITKKQVGEDLAVKFVRDKKNVDLKLRLKSFKALVPDFKHYEKPPFFIYGGLVYTVLSADLLKAWGDQWVKHAPLNLKFYFLGNGNLNLEKSIEKVVLLDVIPDDINIGYHNFGNMIVQRVNGQEFSSFKEFIELTIQGKKTKKYNVFKMIDQKTIVIRNKDIDETDGKILKRNNISSGASEEVYRWIMEEGK